MKDDLSLAFDHLFSVVCDFVVVEMEWEGCDHGAVASVTLVSKEHRIGTDRKRVAFYF